MLANWHRLALSLGVCWLSATALSGCYGTSDHDDGSSGGSGGAGTGGGAGKGGAGSCVVGQSVIADGQSYSAGCNTCYCSQGTLSCTTLYCGDDCTYQGVTYSVGESFPAGDGCNTC